MVCKYAYRWYAILLGMAKPYIMYSCCVDPPFWSPVGMPRMALQELHSSSSACASFINDDNKCCFHGKNGNLSQLFVVGLWGWWIFVWVYHGLPHDKRYLCYVYWIEAIQPCQVQAPQQKLCIFKLVIHLGLLNHHNDICTMTSVLNRSNSFDLGL